ncbi:MAG: glycerol-3-phosphate 1-O-acyltransferase PlsY [Burkholderiales bacterium]|jgi:glycerol-3-phosphate acyltransferase PlsY|nr:glycerol-3-phosphate 1-O-acyltransferase PlsY [Burkholderiales bacterium]
MPINLAISFAFVVAAYLIGSISFAVVVSKAMNLPDPQSYGSGNPGATNVLRTGNKTAAALTLLGDALKGFFAVWAALHFQASLNLADWTVPAVAFAVFLGHILPVFHRFKGGKGVATVAGILLALHWPLALGLIVVWLIFAVGFKISSLAALIAALCMLAGMFYFFGNTLVSWTMVVIALLLIWRHKSNIERLLKGKEGKIEGKTR